MRVKKKPLKVDFAVPVDNRVKPKANEKSDKYRAFVRELKKLWNMKVTVIPVVIGVLGIVIKGLVQRMEDVEIKGLAETIQIIALRSAKNMRKVLDT